MHFKSTEGVHYIFDRYAFMNNMLAEHFEKRDILTLGDDKILHTHLDTDTNNIQSYIGDKEGNPSYSRPFGDAQDHKDFFMLDLNSDKAAIHNAFKHAQVLYHPDRFIGHSKSIQKEAEANRALIAQSKDILQNENLRPLYAERLLEFYNKNASLVSQDGTVILPMNEEQDFFDLDSILDDQEMDTSAFEDQLKQAAQFDDNLFEQAQSLFESMQDNDQIRTVYKSALNQKLFYLTLMETAAWAKIGYGNKKDKTKGHVLQADGYLDAVEQELSDVIKNELPKAVSTRNNALMIGTAKPPLLLTDQNQPIKENAIAVMDKEAVEKVISKARGNMEERAQYIRDIAQQKQGVLEELVTLCDIKPLTDHDTDNPNHIIILAQNLPDSNETTFTIAYNLDVQNGSLNMMEETHEFSGEDLEIAASKLSLPDSNVFLLIQNNAIEDFQTEIMAAAGIISEEWHNAQEPSQTNENTPDI